MPNVRVMIWNIQNFGSNTTAYQAAKGNNSSALAPFIAHVVREYNIDVLFIQEVFETAGPSLDNVRTALNNGLPEAWWSYDWIKGAFAESTLDGTLRGPQDLAWDSGRAPTTRRAEGYAVFWRNDAARFQMVPAEAVMSQGVVHTGYNPNPALPANCLQLTRWGRKFDTTGRQWQALKGFRSTNWSESDFEIAKYPDVNKNDRDAVFWDYVRRPAYCVIRLGTGGTDEDRLCPIMAYHAPSNRSISNRATYISGLAEQLYITRSLQNGVPGGAY